MSRFAALLMLLASCATSGGGGVTAVSKDAVSWQQAPGLNTGLLTAIEWGDPLPGPYQALIRFPAGLLVQPHYHKVDEFATIASGSVIFGQGETVDESKGVEASAGGYVTIPANTAHWAKCTKDATTV